MASLNEITTSLATNFNEQNNFEFKKRLVHMVNSWRATLIKRALDKGDSLVESLQSFNAELIKVPQSQCPEFGCTVLRTKLKIPKLLRTSSSQIFSFVGDIIGNQAYSFIYPEHAGFAKASKYTGGKIKYSYYNDYLWVFQNTQLKWLGVRGMFEDPTKLKDFQCVDSEEDCFSLNSEYPVSADILQQIESAVLAELRAQQAPIRNEEIKVNE